MKLTIGNMIAEGTPAELATFVAARTETVEVVKPEFARVGNWQDAAHHEELVLALYTQTHNVREVERLLADYYVFPPSYPTLLKQTRGMHVCPRRKN